MSGLGGTSPPALAEPGVNLSTFRDSGHVSVVSRLSETPFSWRWARQSKTIVLGFCLCAAAWLVGCHDRLVGRRRRRRPERVAASPSTFRADVMSYSALARVKSAMSARSSELIDSHSGTHNDNFEARRSTHRHGYCPGSELHPKLMFSRQSGLHLIQLLNANNALRQCAQAHKLRAFCVRVPYLTFFRSFVNAVAAAVRWLVIVTYVATCTALPPIATYPSQAHCSMS